MYTRLHPSSSFPGTGLGLAICKRIVEQMEGTISLKANECKGSTFILDLPYERAIGSSIAVDAQRMASRQ